MDSDNGQCRLYGAIDVVAARTESDHQLTASWVLVGDAGRFIDPRPAQGISDALRQGEKLAADIRADGESPGIVTDMIRDLGNERDGALRFLRLLNHELAPSQVFYPARLARTVARATVRDPRPA